MAVILKIKWRRILRIIWRTQPNRVRAALGASVKRPMSGHVRNVRQSWTEDAKPDSMIVGRKSGPPARHVGGARQAPPHSVQKRRHLIFKMTLNARSLPRAGAWHIRITFPGTAAAYSRRFERQFYPPAYRLALPRRFHGGGETIRSK
jgi:hypothetical protein